MSGCRLAVGSLMIVVKILLLPCDQACNVDSFSVQPNFDLDKYMGKWYEIRWLAPKFIPPNERFQDYKHDYVKLANGNVTGYVDGRDPQHTDRCFYQTIELSTTDTPGKMVFTDYNGVSIPYWVMKTDYKGFAVVYGCYNKSVDGTCQGARSWIWSRTKTLDQSLLNEAETVIRSLCLNTTEYLTTDHNNACPVKTHWSVRKGQDCKVSSIKVQSKFSLQKDAGTWYEMRWLAPSYIPPDQLFQDYQHEYTINSDGNVTGRIRGRSPKDPEKCFYNTISLFMTDIPGKMIYNFNESVPYWMIKTDYTQYAVVYGCYNKSADDTCYEARSWVWSRTRTLPKSVQYEINSLLQDICVNPTAYLRTAQKKECPSQTQGGITSRPCWLQVFSTALLLLLADHLNIQLIT